MRRIAVLLALTALAFGALAGPAVAAPTKGQVASLDCGDDGTVEILVRTDNGGTPVFDPSGATNGRLFVLSFLDVRIYAGELTEEPAGEPLFAFSQTWGKRKGYDRMLTCASEAFVLQDGEGNVVTAFFDAVLAGK